MPFLKIWGVLPPDREAKGLEVPLGLFLATSTLSSLTTAPPADM